MSAPRHSQGLPITRRPWTQPQPETNSPLKEVCANNGMSDPSHRDREPAGMLINLHLICMTTSPFQDRRTPRPSWPPGGARSKGLARHSASKQSLQSWLILVGAFDPHPFSTPCLHSQFSERELRLLEAGLLSRILHLSPCAPGHTMAAFPSCWGGRCGIPAQ